jgi:hypothetical protein
MPFIESFEDIAKWVADKIVIYDSKNYFEEHSEDCSCRVCFTSRFLDRMLQAAKRESLSEEERFAAWWCARPYGPKGLEKQIVELVRYRKCSDDGDSDVLAYYDTWIAARMR